MAYIREYWTDKEKRATLAQEHTDRMEREYGERIKQSVRDTIMYYPDFSCNRKTEDVSTEIIIDNIDSVSAILKCGNTDTDGKRAILNFSSYKNPGGMFLNGSKAQEECLCHESYLYNVLSKIEGFYDWNNKHKNKALYLNRGLYSPNILC